MSDKTSCSTSEDARAAAIKKRAIAMGTDIFQLFTDKHVPRGEAILALCGILGTLAARFPGVPEMHELDCQSTLVAEMMLEILIQGGNNADLPHD